MAFQQDQTQPQPTSKLCQNQGLSTMFFEKNLLKSQIFLVVDGLKEGESLKRSPILVFIGRGLIYTIHALLRLVGTPGRQRSRFSLLSD